MLNTNEMSERKCIKFIRNTNGFDENLPQLKNTPIVVSDSKGAEHVIIRSDFKEAVWCKIKLRQNDTFLVGCLYRSPNSSDRNSLELMELFKTGKDTRD